MIAKHLIDFAMHFDKLMVNSIIQHLNSIKMLEMSLVKILQLVKNLVVSLEKFEYSQSNLVLKVIDLINWIVMIIKLILDCL